MTCSNLHKPLKLGVFQQTSPFPIMFHFLAFSTDYFDDLTRYLTIFPPKVKNGGVFISLLWELMSWVDSTWSTANSRIFQIFKSEGFFLLLYPSFAIRVKYWRCWRRIKRWLLQYRLITFLIGLFKPIYWVILNLFSEFVWMFHQIIFEFKPEIFRTLYKHFNLW